MNKEEILEGMKKISDYFEIHSKSDSLFLPEYEAAIFINNLIETSDKLNETRVIKMIAKINQTEECKHYNGSGWLDYKMHFMGLMKNNRFKVDSDFTGKLKLK